MLYGGGSADIDNSVVEAGPATALYLVSAATGNTRLNLDSSTIVSAGHPTVPAIDGTVQNQLNYGSIRIKVRNSIFRDFNSTYDLTAPSGEGSVGDTNISFEYSNFNLFGTQTGDGTTYIPANNINQDPLFSSSGDYSLSPGSPSIDAGDPDGTLDPAFDIGGTIRPLDGNGDGKAIQDQGAYEFNPAACVPANSCIPGDKTPPTVSKVKFKKPSKKKGASVSLKLSEAAKVQLTFKPVGKTKQKRKTVKVSKSGKTGANTVKLKKGQLKTGKYKLSISATETAGNKSTQRVRNVTTQEIVAQLGVAREKLGDFPGLTPPDDGLIPSGEGVRAVSNVVFMGMGEPLYNLDNVCDALAIMTDGDGVSL